MARDVMRAAADLTPDALAGLMSLAATISTAPTLSGYEIESHTVQGEDHLFRVRFNTSAGDVRVNAAWRDVEGLWKIVAVSVEGLSP
jgi:hypothetical protein